MAQDPNAPPADDGAAVTAEADDPYVALSSDEERDFDSNSSELDLEDIACVQRCMSHIHVLRNILNLHLYIYNRNLCKVLPNPPFL